MPIARVHVKCEDEVRDITLTFKFKKPQDLRAKILAMAKSPATAADEDKNNNPDLAETALTALTSLNTSSSTQSEEKDDDAISPFSGLRLADLRDKISTEFEVPKSNVSIFSRVTTKEILSKDLHSELDDWEKDSEQREEAWKEVSVFILSKS